MPDHSTPSESSARANPSEATVKDLPPQDATEVTSAADAQTVKGGLGVNRLVVTDGTITPK